MKIHFYDLLTAGRNPAEGQVLRFHSALYADGVPAQEQRLAVRLRDDVPIPVKDIESSPLSVLNLGAGIAETEFARSAAVIFSEPDTLHVGISTTSKLDPYIRHSIYRSLIPGRCVTIAPESRHLDLDTLLRAMILLRPETVPSRISGKLKQLDRDIHSLFWDADWDAENRAHRVRELMTAAQASSPRFVEHAVSRTSTASLKSSLGLDAGEVSDLSHVQPGVFVHPSILAPGGFAVLYPLAIDINYPDIAYMADLTIDLSRLVDENTTSLESLVRKAPDDGQPIVRVSFSRMPFVAPLKIIRPEDARRLKLDGAVLRANVQLLRASHHLAARLRDEPILELAPLSADVDHRMWAGEFTPSDLSLMEQLQSSSMSDWPALAHKAHDFRISELINRALARERPDLLDQTQLAAWHKHLQARVKLASPTSLEVQIQALQNAASVYPSARGIEHLLTRLKKISAFT